MVVGKNGAYDVADTVIVESHVVYCSRHVDSSGERAGYWQGDLGGFAIVLPLGTNRELGKH